MFSCGGDECVLVVILEAGREERHEFVRRGVRHADGEGDTIRSPNSFNEGGGARRRPKVDQSPRRSMKPPLLPGVVWPVELLLE